MHYAIRIKQLLTPINQDTFHILVQPKMKTVIYTNCMIFICLSNTKEDLLKNAGNQKVAFSL